MNRLPYCQVIRLQDRDEEDTTTMVSILHPYAELASQALTLKFLQAGGTVEEEIGHIEDWGTMVLLKTDLPLYEVTPRVLEYFKNYDTWQLGNNGWQTVDADGRRRVACPSDWPDEDDQDGVRQ